MEREEIISRNPIRSYLEGRGHAFKQLGKEWVCMCPIHADRNPSFRVNIEKQTWFCDPCAKGGSIIDLVMIVERLDLKSAMQKLSGDNQEFTPQSKLKEVASYDYTDAIGKLLYQVVRFEPKTFRQRHKQGDNWVWGMSGVERVIYRLSGILEADHVMIVEGEKDADSISDLGMPATCNVGGAGKWIAPYSEFFKGKEVILCPDNDEPGRKHMQDVARSLEGKVKSLRKIEVPHPHKDISDFINSFESKEQASEEILGMIKRAKKIFGGSDIPISSMEELESQYVEHVKAIKNQTLDLGLWLPTLGKHVRGLVPGELVAILADTSAGKTAIAQNIARCCNPIPTLIFELELPGTLTFERFLSLQLKYGGREIEKMYSNGSRVDWKIENKLNHIFVCSESRMTAERLEELIIKSELKMGVKPVLVIVDYLQLMRGKGNSRYERTSDTAEELKVIAKNTGTIIIFTSQVGRKKDDATSEVHLHDGKDSGSVENSAGVVLGCWRDPDDRSKMLVKVAKNTKGPTGMVIQANFHAETLTISERV